MNKKDQSVGDTLLNNEFKEKEIEIKKNKSCFIITPIGDINSTTRRHIEGVLNSVIEPVLKNCNYNLKVAHREYKQGLITENVINGIVDSDLVIANLTQLNPNVMYEVALRHCTDKPIIHICEEDTVLPFDIKDQRTIFYTNDMLGVKELKENLELMMKVIEGDNKYCNIITATRKNKVLIDTVITDGEDNQLNIILKEMMKVRHTLERTKEYTSNKEGYSSKAFRKIYSMDMEYLGDGDFINAAKDAIETLKNKNATINDIDIDTSISNIKFTVYSEPIVYLQILKSLENFNFKEMKKEYEIPF